MKKLTINETTGEPSASPRPSHCTKLDSQTVKDDPQLKRSSWGLKEKGSASEARGNDILDASRGSEDSNTERSQEQTH